MSTRAEERAAKFHNEVLSLRAEVARLKKFIADYDVMEPVELRDIRRERDQALEALSAAQKALRCSLHEEYKTVWCVRCIETEREKTLQLKEALAAWEEGRT